MAPARPEPRLGDSGAVLALIGLALLAFAGVLGSEKGLFYGDHDLVFRQRWWFVVESLGQGRWPARTWASASGVPIEQLLNATYTPPTLLLLLGDFDLLYDIFIVAHVVILALGAYGLARDYRCSPRDAGMVALVAFAGPIFSFENLVVGLAAFAYIPWALWALRHLLRAPTLLSVAAFAAAGGFHLQGIMPETVVLDVCAGLLVLISTPIPRRLPTLLAVGVGVLLAFGLASVELMPVLEALQGTERGSGFDLHEQQQWSVHPVHLLATALPSGLGLPELYELDRPFRPQNREYLVSTYLAWTPELALTALLYRPTRRWALALLGLALVFLLLSLGEHTPVYAWVADLPVLRSGRYPVKYMVHVACALAALLPLGLRAAQEYPKVFAGLLAARLVLVIGIFRALDMPEVQRYLQTWISERTRLSFPYLTLEEFGTAIASALEGRALHAAAFCALALAVVVVGSQGRVRIPWPASLVIVLGLDLAAGARLGIYPVPVQPSDRPEVTALVSSPYYRYFALGPKDVVRPLTRRPDRTPLESKILDLRNRSPSFKSARRANDYNADSQSPRGSTALFELLQRTRVKESMFLLARAGVHEVTTWLHLELPHVAVEVDGERPQYVYQLPATRRYVEAYPHWYLHDWARSSPARLQDILTSEQTFGSAVVYDPSVPAPTATSSVACGGRPQLSLLPSNDADRIEADVITPCPVVIVALETFGPGWHAYVDESPARIFEAEAGFVATYAPAGAHRVRLQYEPLLKRWIPASAGAAAVISILVVGGLFQARRRRATTAMVAKGS